MNMNSLNANLANLATLASTVLLLAGPCAFAGDHGSAELSDALREIVQSDTRWSANPPNAGARVIPPKFQFVRGKDPEGGFARLRIFGFERVDLTAELEVEVKTSSASDSAKSALKTLTAKAKMVDGVVTFAWPPHDSLIDKPGESIVRRLSLKIRGQSSLTEIFYQIIIEPRVTGVFSSDALNISQLPPSPISLNDGESHEILNGQNFLGLLVRVTKGNINVVTTWRTEDGSIEFEEIVSLNAAPPIRSSGLVPSQALISGAANCSTSLQALGNSSFDIYTVSDPIAATRPLLTTH